MAGNHKYKGSIDVDGKAKQDCKQLTDEVQAVHDLRDSTMHIHQHQCDD